MKLFLYFLLITACCADASAATLSFDYPYFNGFDSQRSVHDNQTDIDPANDISGIEDWELQNGWAGKFDLSIAKKSAPGVLQFRGSDLLNPIESYSATMTSWVEVPLETELPVLVYWFRHVLGAENEVVLQVTTPGGVWEDLRFYRSATDSKESRQDSTSLENYRGKKYIAEAIG